MGRPESRRSALRPTGRVIRRTGFGLLLGAVGGWVAGLLRAPKRDGRA